MSSAKLPTCPPYISPSTGFLSCLPAAWIPYAELMRVHKPAGIMYIYYPFLFGSFFAACFSNPIPTPSQMFFANVELFAVAFVLRSVGCTWNDIVDRELDRKVARCRNRPMARGALSPTTAYIFTANQYLMLFALLVRNSTQCLPYIPPLIAMGTFYPFAKRITSYAQIVLGFTLSWGTLVGCIMMKVFPLELGLSPSTMGLLALSLSYVFWTITYDTIYAFQDIEDDMQAGTMSMAIRHRNHIKPFLFVMSLIQTGFLDLTGVMISAGPAFYTGVVSTAVLLVQMVAAVKVENPSSCRWWFKYGALLVGGSEFLSLLGEYLRRL